MLNSKEKKSNLEMFIKLITGHFNNKEQFEEMQKSGRVYPYAEHVNTVCNDKIKNLPSGFSGKVSCRRKLLWNEWKKTRILPYFLFTEEKGGILLSSYEIPAGADKNTFTYDSMLPVEYSELKKSEKFTPALYLENDGVWEGGSTSQFTPVMKFKLWERFSETGLEVAESMEVNGKRTFGYDVPILYKRA